MPSTGSFAVFWVLLSTVVARLNSVSSDSQPDPVVSASGLTRSARLRSEELVLMTAGDDDDDAVVGGNEAAVKGDGDDGELEELVGRAVAQCSAMLAKSNNFSIALRRAWCWGRGILIRWSL